MFVAAVLSFVEQVGPGQEMRSLESKTHSFIVKMWLEEMDCEADAKWRGHITHVPDGARRYLDNVDAIPEFITPYLKGTTTKAKRLTRLRQWLHIRR